MNWYVIPPMDTVGVKPRLLTGDRPTGPLHIGHFVGSLQARVALQDSHECFFIVADLHTLTTRPEKSYIGELPKHVRNVVLDLLSVGVDPKRATVYLQSGVPAVYDLAILLQMLVSTSRLSRIPSLKDMARSAHLDENTMPLGLLGYPVLQAADILMARAQVVPVGKDNEAHVEIARELARRFNHLYGEVFPIPEAMISRVPVLPGVGTGEGGAFTKMSNSAGNAVFLDDPTDEVARKIRTIPGDPKRVHAATPGEPGGTSLFAFVDAFLPKARADKLAEDYRSGTVRDGDIKDELIASLEAILVPLRARRAQLAGETGFVDEILVDGTIRAREVAYQTLQKVRDAMGLEQLWSDLVAATGKRAQRRKRSP